MLKRLADLFLSSPNPAGYREAISAPLAACVVLLEAARADQEFSDEERGAVLSILQSRYGLSREEAHELMEEAAAVRAESADLWKFTRRVNETCSNEEKRRLMEEIWRVIYADGVLHGHEDYLAHKLRDLLNLSQPELIAAKIRVLKEIRGE